jgi:hypothetical protein
MSNRQFVVPKWMPRAVSENDPAARDDLGYAIRFGFVQPVAILSSLGSYLGPLGSGAAAIGWVVLVTTIVRDPESLVSLIALMIGAASARRWFRAHPGLAAPIRITKTIAVGLASAFSTAALAVLVILAFIPVIAFGLWKTKRNDDAFARDQRELNDQATGLKPWVVFWGLVTNDDKNAEEWAKVRPCIALPGRDSWLDGAPAIEYRPDLPGRWFSDGYPVLICTSQVKRNTDDRYLEIRPFPGDTTRNFVQLDVAHLVMNQLAPTDKATQLSMLHQRQLDGCFVVLEQLGPLLNLEDRRRIADALRDRSVSSSPVDSPGPRAATPPAAWAPPVAEEHQPPALRTLSDSIISSLGDPEVWTWLLPNIRSVSPQTRKQYVGLVVDMVNYAILVAKTSELATAESDDPIRRRHRALAVLTGLLVRRSTLYRELLTGESGKESTGRLVHLGYALAMATETAPPGNPLTLIGIAAEELSWDLYLEFFGSRATVNLVELVDDDLAS